MLSLVGHDEGRERMEYQLRQNCTKDWGRHRSLQRFLEDYFPDRWEAVRQCETRYRYSREIYPTPGLLKVQAIPCRKIPYCIRCTDRAVSQRASKALQVIHEITPPGQPIRLAHAVQTAPIYDDGAGWGNAASQDIGAFMQAVWNTTQHIYGDGLGVIASYQDFGETGPRKRHPHVDYTIHGYAWNGQLRTLHHPDLRSNTYHDIQQHLTQQLPQFNPQGKPGNLKIVFKWLGAREYRAILEYQLRELWDFRKLRYNPDAREIEWTSYKTQSTIYKVNDWLEHFAEYQRRLGSFNHHQTTNLHRRFGLLAKKNHARASNVIGGPASRHRANCWCTRCRDWQPIPRA